MSFHPNPYVVQTPNPSNLNQTPKPVISFLQSRVPYTMCPFCNTNPVKNVGMNHFTCPSFHQFHKCPTCLDTRIADKRENVFYCGLMHPYHLCPIHNKPVMGVSQFTMRCTCANNPSDLTRKRKIDSWETPFV